MKMTRHELPDNTTVTIEVQHVYKNKYSACGVGYVSVVGNAKGTLYSFYHMSTKAKQIQWYVGILKENIDNLAFKSAKERQRILQNYLDDSQFITRLGCTVC